MLNRRELTRREFASGMAASVAAWQVGSRVALAQGPASFHPEFSIMMWTLRKLGTFEENLEKVGKAGYPHVELTGEFKTWKPEEKTRIMARMKGLGITVDSTSGMAKGFADPAGGDAFVEDLKAFIPVVQSLGCSQIILLSGKRLDGVTMEAQHNAAIENLKRGAEVLGAAGMSGVIEPIDHLENPGIYLDGVAEACAITKAVGSPHVKVLCDLYHEQRGKGNLMETVDKGFDQIGLIHIADVPGRHEPGTGEVNYANIYRQLAKLGYKGVIAMEFYPTGDIVQALKTARDQVLQA